MEENIKYELEDLRSIADGAVPPELSKNEAKNIINFIENLIKGYKELEETDLTQVYLKGVYDERDKWKSKVREKIEKKYGTLCMKLGSYIKDEATPEQERIAGGINELRKLKEELLKEGDK